MFMGTPLDGAGGGRGGLGGTEGRAAGGERSTEKGVGRARAERAGVTVMGDQREFDLETRVTTNGNNKTPRCFTVVY